MSRAFFAVLACTWLSACQSCGPLEQGRYQCDPKIRLEDEPAGGPQCPGNSRCGLEKFCHAIGDVSVAWRCETRDNCENGYECGLSTDGTSRECHNPEAADAGFACELQSDCVRGWRCGVEKVCYDRGEKKPYPCRRDGGDSDCSSGWRCGLAATCHDTAVAADYPCGSDLDCEQGWRCGLERRCLDTIVDALRPAGSTLGAPEKVNPLLLDHAPELLAASPVQSPTFSLPRQSLAYYDQGQLTVIDLAVGGVPAIGSNPHRVQTLTDAGDVTALATLGSISLDPFAVFDVGSWTYVTRPDGGFVELHFRTQPGPFAFDGTPYRVVSELSQGVFTPVSFGPDRLRVGTTEDGQVPTLSAFDQRPFFPGENKKHFYGWGARSRGSFSPTSPGYVSDLATMGGVFEVPSNRIVDFATLTAHRINDFGIREQTDCTVIADQQGLFVQQLELSRTFSSRRQPPQPLRAGPIYNEACTAQTGVAPNYRITGLSGLGRDWLGVRAHPIDAGVVDSQVEEVALLNVSHWWEVVDADHPRYPFRGCVTSLQASCRPFPSGVFIQQPVFATSVQGPCPVCESSKLVSLSVVPSQSGGAHLEVRCRTGAADGGQGVDSVVEVTAGPGTSCVSTPLQLASSIGSDVVRISTSNSGQLAFAGPRGHLWVGRSSSTANPVFFDQAPSGVVSDAQDAPLFVASDRIGWYVGAPFGILAFPVSPKDGARAAAVVDGLPRTIVTGGRSVVAFTANQLRVIAIADGTPTRFDPPYHAVGVAQPDGGGAVVVSAGDVILTANLGLPQPVLTRRLVPAEGRAILSLLALPRPGSLTTFALTASALFKVTADADQVWTSAQAPLPPGSPLELWADRDRGRIGYADGRVFSLETRVQIGAALNLRVDDFSHSCGQAYALAEGSLHRLVVNPDGGPVGQWSPVLLDGGIPASELAQGKLLPFTEPDGGTTLYVFSRRGEAMRMPVTCQ